MNPVTENTKTDKKQSMKLEIKLAVTLDEEVVTMLFLNLNDFMSNFILKKIAILFLKVTMPLYIFTSNV